jgi:hypothetical protein
MLVLDQLTRLSAEEVRCRITRDGKPSEFTVRISQSDSMRGFNLERLSKALTWELSNCDEFRALLKTIGAYVDGASVALPKEIVSDWPTDDQETAKRLMTND